MNETLKPTHMPDDLRSALYVVLERIRRAYHFELMKRDELLDDALEVVRCHLVGITTSDTLEMIIEPLVRGEGWSL